MSNPFDEPTEIPMTTEQKSRAEGWAEKISDMILMAKSDGFVVYMNNECCGCGAGLALAIGTETSPDDDDILIYGSR